MVNMEMLYDEVIADYEKKLSENEEYKVKSQRFSELYKNVQNCLSEENCKTLFEMMELKEELEGIADMARFEIAFSLGQNYKEN